MKFKTYKYYHFFLLAFKKGIILCSIILSPSFCLLLADSLISVNKPPVNVFEGQILNLSLVFLAVALTQILFAGIRLSSMSVFTYATFPFIVIVFISVKKLFFELQYIQGIKEKYIQGVKGIDVQDYITLAISFLYFLLINTFIEISKVESNTRTPIVQYTLDIKTPRFLVKLLNIENKVVKNLLYVLLRLILYTGLSILFTFIIVKYFPFERNIPNYFGVFSTIWTVLTFVMELFITRMRKVDN